MFLLSYTCVLTVVKYTDMLCYASCVHNTSIFDDDDDDDEYSLGPIAYYTNRELLVFEYLKKLYFSLLFRFWAVR